MEKLSLLLIPGLLALLFVRLILYPMKLAAKLVLHSGCGLVCLWLLNAVSPYSGILFPINAVTVLTAGFLGLPGIGLLALLAVI